ncbi:MAG: NAD regulator [Marinicaulis sp.]|nr:NAD regulator [Marinicaulis sp.]
MNKSEMRETTTEVAISLNAVLFAMSADDPCVLCLQQDNTETGLPSGPFDPERHRTFEIGVREWVERQTEVSLGHIEQLYTFGDKDRDDESTTRRHISVGYLALAPSPAPVQSSKARWINWYTLFPWEDLRAGSSKILNDRIIPALIDWADQSGTEMQRTNRRQRICVAFGLEEYEWEEALSLDRYELMYEARLVSEAYRNDPNKFSNLNDVLQLSRPMISDHRRILATAIGRLRGKLRYRPVLFEMAPDSFTLLQLQSMTEAIVGFRFHKQNFRRSIENSGFVERTDEAIRHATGRPAAIFKVNKRGLREKASSGVTIPRIQKAVKNDDPN